MSPCLCNTDKVLQGPLRPLTIEEGKNPDVARRCTEYIRSLSTRQLHSQSAPIQPTTSHRIMHFTIIMAAVAVPLLLPLLTTTEQTSSTIPGLSAYTVSAGFPSSAFPTYYEAPVETQEPQPALYDPVLNITFPLNLTNPETIPTIDNDPLYYPQPLANISNSSTAALLQAAFTNITGIIESNTTASNCTKCKAALSVGKTVAQYAPESVPGLLVKLCETFQFGSNATCVDNYAAGSFGAIWTQVLALADVTGLDGQYICNDLSSKFCPAPTTSSLNMTGLFPKPKPKHARAPKASGNRVKVLHLSDFHLDPRYSASSEANCSSGLCCRANVHSAGSIAGQVAVPAPLYGWFKCDTPYYLGLAALQAIAPLTGTHGNSSVAWTIYTGDLVSHDSQNQLSRAYTEYAETSVYDLFKEYIGSPVFPVLGNHDSNPEAIDAPHSFPGSLGTKQFSWNYNHVSALWEHNGWINSTTANEARLHYAAYSVLNQYGLRIITLNTDFWYKSNFL